MTTKMQRPCRKSVLLKQTEGFVHAQLWIQLEPLMGVVLSLTDVWWRDTAISCLKGSVHFLH
jgi:hypothetical protein